MNLLKIPHYLIYKFCIFNRNLYLTKITTARKEAILIQNQDSINNHYINQGVYLAYAIGAMYRVH